MDISDNQTLGASSMAESSPAVSITDSVIPSLVSMLTSADFFFSVLVNRRNQIL
jgi:hypothetical protein